MQRSICVECKGRIPYAPGTSGKIALEVEHLLSRTPLNHLPFTLCEWIGASISCVHHHPDLPSSQASRRHYLPHKGRHFVLEASSIVHSAEPQSFSVSNTPLVVETLSEIASRTDCSGFRKECIKSVIRSSPFCSIFTLGFQPDSKVLWSRTFSSISK